MEKPISRINATAGHAYAAFLHGRGWTSRNPHQLECVLRPQTLTLFTTADDDRNVWLYIAIPKASCRPNTRLIMAVSEGRHLSSRSRRDSQRLRRRSGRAKPPLVARSLQFSASADDPTPTRPARHHFGPGEQRRASAEADRGAPQAALRRSPASPVLPTVQDIQSSIAPAGAVPYHAGRDPSKTDHGVSCCRPLIPIRCS